MIKPSDYDSVQAASYGDAEANAPQPGGHGCIIHKGAVVKDDYGEKLVLWFDIKEGSDSDGFYAKRYERDKQYAKDGASPKWRGEFKQPIYTKDNTTSPYFKGLIHSIEKSNPGYTWTWREDTLKGKRLGLVFREEEFIGKNDGQLHTTTRAAWACDWDSYPQMPAPNKKLLKKDAAARQPQQLTPADEETLPF